MSLNAGRELGGKKLWPSSYFRSRMAYLSTYSRQLPLSTRRALPVDMIYLQSSSGFGCDTFYFLYFPECTMLETKGNVEVRQI